MNAPVTTDIIDRIGVIRIDNPPVNALNNAVRSGIADAVTALCQDSGLDAVVIACAGRTFIAGADIKEFGKPRQPPALEETCDAIEADRTSVGTEQDVAGRGNICGRCIVNNKNTKVKE